MLERTAQPVAPNTSIISSLAPLSFSSKVLMNQSAKFVHLENVLNLGFSQVHKIGNVGIRGLLGDTPELQSVASGEI